VIAALLAAFHYLALAIGLPAIFSRGRALKGTLDPAGIRRVLAADAWWGIAALLWILTGPGRVFGPFEKGADFYLGSKLFWIKLSLFGLIVGMEILPMVTLIGWRRRLARGETPDTSSARRLAAASHAQMALVVVMIFVASFMARGFGR